MPAFNAAAVFRVGKLCLAAKRADEAKNPRKMPDFSAFSLHMQAASKNRFAVEGADNPAD